MGVCVDAVVCMWLTYCYLALTVAVLSVCECVFWFVWVDILVFGIDDRRIVCECVYRYEWVDVLVFGVDDRRIVCEFVYEFLCWLTYWYLALTIAVVSGFCRKRSLVRNCCSIFCACLDMPVIKIEAISIKCAYNKLWENRHQTLHLKIYVKHIILES